MFRGDKDDVANGAADVDVGQPEGLGVYGAVHGAGEKFAEGTDRHGGREERLFAGIVAVARAVLW